ncbi:MAG: response regulator [Candidatus Omnitrophica bacterium]|nr:response regulator [Candidatus Omnitrophota bacterium]
MAKKILIVEDEKLITKSLARLLDKKGYDTVIANTGEEAIQKVASSDFDLIISDIRMPEKDGIETIIEIRALLKKEDKPLIPEILITGYADEEKYKSAIDLKVAGYLYKPFDTEDLMEAIENALK